MDAKLKQLESVYQIIFHFVWTTAIVVVVAVGQRERTLAIAALAVFGIVLITRAVVSFLILRHLSRRGYGMSFVFSFGAGTYAAIFQIILGIAAFVGVTEALTGNYLFSKTLFTYILTSNATVVGFVLLYIVVGIWIISGTVIYENKKLKITSPKELPLLIQGAAYLIGGLAMVTLYVYSQFIF